MLPFPFDNLSIERDDQMEMEIRILCKDAYMRSPVIPRDFFILSNFGIYKVAQNEEIPWITPI